MGVEDDEPETSRKEKVRKNVRTVNIKRESGNHIQRKPKKPQPVKQTSTHELHSSNTDLTL